VGINLKEPNMNTYLVKAWLDAPDTNTIFLEVEANSHFEACKIMKYQINIAAVEKPDVKC